VVLVVFGARATPPAHKNHYGSTNACNTSDTLPLRFH
jgi:hypothetical protein